MLGRALSLLSALAGIAGTIVLFNGSFAYETMMHWSSRDMASQMAQRNRRRKRLQQVGLGLLLVSFVLQGIGAVV
jgi:hypothetical protein